MLSAKIIQKIHLKDFVVSLMMGIFFAACNGTDMRGGSRSNGSPNGNSDISSTPTPSASTTTPPPGSSPSPTVIVDPPGPTPTGKVDGSGDLTCGGRTYRINNNCVSAGPMYRWKNDISGKYFYTMTADQSCQLLNAPLDPNGCNAEYTKGGGWRYEAIAFYTYPATSATEAPAFAKFYRYFHLSGLFHVYQTTPLSDANVYRFEHAYHVFKSKEPNTTRLYHWRYVDGFNHYYTIDNNAGALLNAPGSPSTWTLDTSEPAIFVFLP